MKEKCTRNVGGMRNVSIDGRVVAMVASTLPLASGKGLRTLPPSFFLSLSPRVFKPQPGDVQRKESRISLSYRAWMQITGRVDDRQHSWTDGDGGKVGENETRDGSCSLLSRLPPCN